MSIITKLSDEVLLHIFKFLPTYSILRQVGPVCKRFYRLCKDSSVIKEIIVSNVEDILISSQNYKDLIDVLGRSRCLTKFALNGCKDEERWNQQKCQILLPLLSAICSINFR